MLNVLLTNDDRIEADGLQAMRRALTLVDGVRLAVIAPDDKPLGDGPLDHHTQAAVGVGRWLGSPIRSGCAQASV